MGASMKPTLTVGVRSGRAEHEESSIARVSQGVDKGKTNGLKHLKRSKSAEGIGQKKS
jgi:hypothetical protein